MSIPMKIKKKIGHEKNIMLILLKKFFMIIIIG